MSSVLRFSSYSVLESNGSSDLSSLSSSSLSAKAAISILFSDTQFPEKPPNSLRSSYRPFKIRLSQTQHTSSTKNRGKSQPSNPNFSFLSDTLLSTNSAVKVPTPPWMQGPLVLPCNEVLDLSRARGKKGKSRGEESERSDAALTEKVSGGRGRQAMRRVVESITKLQESRNSEETRKDLEKFELRVPLESIGGDGKSNCEVRMPWMSQEKIVFRRMKKEKVVTRAALSLDETTLKRLRNDAAKMKTWVKAKKAGVTERVVDEIKRAWRENELAMVKFRFPLCRNMDRAREILELKSGGLVVWSKKDTHVVYRGCSYNSSLNVFQRIHSKNGHVVDPSPLHVSVVKPEGKTTISCIRQDEVTQAGRKSIHEFIGENLELQSVSGTLYEREADRLLNGLGPRFVDWWWPKPLPVDADLLPEVVPGFMTQFRCCLPHVKSKLTDDELTNLRKFARYLPTHFALGRNTKLQGLANAMIKLWEKSPIAKIAVKLGIPNTNDKLMAQELKHLTGGVLILRNKFFIIFFRGKDFLPSEVANLVLARERELERCQLHEEGARCKPINSCYAVDEIIATSSSGTFSEFKHMKKKYGTITEDFDIQMETEKEKLQRELRREEHRLFALKKKIAKSAKELSKLNSEWEPAEQSTDLEMITEEERQCLRKIGLKVDKILMLGRRGIFDGVIGNMHLHWKHREIVKVITMQKTLSQVNYTARQLEVESGGILIAVEKIRKGHAIILYRGKNYQRPLNLFPGNLLKKKAALRRSLELQRIGSLKFFACQRQRRISNLKPKLKDLQDGDEEAALEECRKL